MRLTADMRLTRNSRLINGRKNSGRCFRCFRKTAHSTWQSVKQVLWRASFVAVTFTSRSGGRFSGEILTLEREEGYNHDNSLSIFPSMVLSLAMFFDSFRGYFGTSSGTERPSLVKFNTDGRKRTCSVMVQKLKIIAGPDL